MSSATQGITNWFRAYSKLGGRKRPGALTPEHRIPYSSNGVAPGAIGIWIFTAPARCKVVEIRETHEVAGAGASKLYVRKHVAGQTAAANAAVSGSNIVDLVTGGIAADSAVRVPQDATVVTASAELLEGAKLAVLPPATWVGLVEIYVVFI